MVTMILSGESIAQQHFDDSLAQARNKLTRGAMITLGGWAVANITSGFILAANTSGETKYFWQMNAYWNFINLGLAGLGYVGMLKAASLKFGFAENYKAQQQIEKLYVFNAGLDLAYMAGGFYLRERGKTETKQDSMDKFGGYGTSIITQGGFLLIMDVFMYSIHHKNTRVMDRRLQHFELNAGPAGLAVTYTF
jgi:hypothetical protein